MYAAAPPPVIRVLCILRKNSDVKRTSFSLQYFQEVIQRRSASRRVIRAREYEMPTSLFSRVFCKLSFRITSTACTVAFVEISALEKNIRVYNANTMPSISLFCVANFVTYSRYTHLCENGTFSKAHRCSIPTVVTCSSTWIRRSGLTHSRHCSGVISFFP